MYQKQKQCLWTQLRETGACSRSESGIKYDEDARLAAAWLPELAALPPPLRHQPWLLSGAEAEAYGFEPGRSYPAPMVDPAGQTGQLPGEKGEGKGNGRGKGKGEGEGKAEVEGTGKAKRRTGRKGAA
ncbi:Cryptochrome DASH [Tetrabaena socialis]|uniref:Cryptochrome DASH n=1 Tax=Tetrabaena socialis TaxID=47790 RepID=A0A2J8ADP9_9CHLO|nr:Cryptochrome DASH [Tetrabaena socialis]|eukprot:PNH10639.1 Cryptochrome DASH [Tetrabaena socialis]